MLAGSAGGSVKMRNKRHRNNFIKVDGFIEYGKKRIFVVIKFILAIGKNICQRKLFVCYHIGTTPLLVDMVNCYWISQFYHKPVRSCFILLKKESCIYAGSGVSQTPITFSLKGEMILKEIILYLVLPIVLLVVAVVLIGFGFQRLTKPFYGVLGVASIFLGIAILAKALLIPFNHFQQVSSEKTRSEVIEYVEDGYTVY